MRTDLHLSRGTARSALTRVVTFTGVILLLWFTSVKAITYPAGSDYLLPSEAKGGFVISSASIESGQSSKKESSTVNYVAMDGQSYQLLENRGRYVNVLIPQSYEEGPFFTEDHIEELVDRLDILYSIYTDIIQNEPAGSGLLNIAFVPQTCGTACGLLGSRGIEIMSDKRNYEAIINELNAGRLDRLLLHEMAHNFDIYSNYLHYLPDHPHAWTDMFEYFAPFRYSRINGQGVEADDQYNSQMSSVWKEYVTEQAANWEYCVKDNSCADMGMSANNLWAMLYYRIEAIHGIDAILDSFEFLNTYASTNPPPTSKENKEGLRILSLAVGAETNISCYLEALKWPVLSSIKTEMENRFGNGNGLCVDQDMDGYSAITGDCDDTDALRNIAQSEISGNSIDDDCDELVDEITWVEADEGTSTDNFKQLLQTELPFEVLGSSAHADDRDSFSFALPASGRARVTLCASDGFKGWLVALQPNGSFLDTSNWFSYQSAPGCTSNTFDFGKFKTGGLLVMPDDASGNYSLKVNGSDELLADHSPLVQVLPRTGNGMVLKVSDENGLFSSLGADEVEIWISGIGVRLSAPFNAVSEIELNASTVPALRAGESYQARVRPRANGLPLAAFSAGHLFRYDPVSNALPVLDDRFSGAWFDPGHDGEGFMVEILEDNRAIVYWFTYQADGSQRWMLGVGAVDGNRVTIPELLDTHGGKFGVDFNPDDVVLNNVGSLTISFLDCSTALVNYSVDNNGGQQDNSRLTQLYGHGCDSNVAVPDNDISGSWYDPSHNGEGFIVEQISANDAVVVWFTYDDAGNQSWMLNAGSIENGKIHVPVMLQPTGGKFGRNFDPESVTQNEWGELTLDLSCSGGTVHYTTQVEGYSDGSQSLVSLAKMANSGCSN